MNNFIGLNIKYLLNKNLLSQGEFGELFGLSQAQIFTYTSGRSNPNIENIQRICKHFQISIDDFINLDLSIYSHNNNAINVVEEPRSGEYGDKDKIITAMADTIETLKKHNATLEKLVENLEEKLSQAS